jgi:hypothetical protein
MGIRAWAWLLAATAFGGLACPAGYPGVDWSALPDRMFKAPGVVYHAGYLHLFASHCFAGEGRPCFFHTCDLWVFEEL